MVRACMHRGILSHLASYTTGATKKHGRLLTPFSFCSFHNHERARRERMTPNTDDRRRGKNAGAPRQDRKWRRYINAGTGVVTRVPSAPDARTRVRTRKFQGRLRPTTLLAVCAYSYVGPRDTFPRKCPNYSSRKFAGCRVATHAIRERFLACIQRAPEIY